MTHPERRPSADLLRATGMTKVFGAVRALDDVSLTVRAGEILALAGENGSGKSTLARILAGALHGDAGEILLDGQPVSFGRPRDALEVGIAIVTQELTAVPQMSVAENVLLTKLHRPHSFVKRRDLARRAQTHLAAVGLDLDPLTPFAALPPGRRELVEVAKALASRPRLLILDEATTRLSDPERLFRLVERLADEEGLATMFITQRLQEIRRLAQRALVLRDGRVAGQLDRSELSDASLTALMVGRELSGYFHKAKVEIGEPVLRTEELVTERSPHPITLETRAGEIVGLAGLVGSGRSELLETIAGVRRARHGRVLMSGRVVRQHSAGAAIAAGMTLLPEDRLAQGLLREGSVSRNVSLASWRPLARATQRRDDGRATTAVASFRIRCSSVQADIRTLSGGNQQKVVLARCLTHDTRALLLDEPTRGVDVGAREEIYAIVADLVSRGVTILVASSDLPELLGLCDRILVLNEGRLAGELSREEATEEAVVLLAAGDGGVEHAA